MPKPFSFFYIDSTGTIHNNQCPNENQDFFAKVEDGEKNGFRSDTNKAVSLEPTSKLGFRFKIAAVSYFKPQTYRCISRF